MIVNEMQINCYVVQRFKNACVWCIIFFIYFVLIILISTKIKEEQNTFYFKILIY